MSFGRPAFALSLAALAMATVRCDNTTCVDRNPDVGVLCLPTTIQPDRTTVIEVREACGICSSPPQCDSRLVDGEVRVDLHAQFCNDGSTSCQTILCLQRKARCTLPSLPAGDWPLVMPGLQTRVMRVRDGGLSSCQLPAP